MKTGLGGEVVNKEKSCKWMFEDLIGSRCHPHWDSLAVASPPMQPYLSGLLIAKAPCDWHNINTKLFRETNFIENTCMVIQFRSGHVNWLYHGTMHKGELVNCSRDHT